ncbi:MAG TPA: AmmeMemoRadiSam system protein B [Gammaproteobacteria bacterium]|nr:AmmeMemoRadiSam system protein B [Gammaproteobacteria bacterium]
MSNIRMPAVAGMFYPDDRRELQGMIRDYLEAVPAASGTEPPKAIIAPHAGYPYSGPVAASVYRRLRPLARTVTRVVLLGPSHRVGFYGLAASGADSFRTPLGDVPVDKEAVAEACRLRQVQVLDQAHQMEHSLEVQLPFLQELLESFRLVPLVVGDASPEEVGEVLELLWGGPETLIVISSDLSHYHDYDTARGMDRATSDAIETLRPEAIGYDNACGRNPVNGLLHVAGKHHLKGETIDLRSSGDTAGPRDAVVGYGAYAFH